MRRYLKPEYGNCTAVLQALADTEANILVFSPNLPQELVNRYQSATMVFSREPFSMRKVVEECDVIVCHAGHDTIASALLARRQLLLLPMQLEQVLLSKSVEKMGIGLTCDTQEKSAEIHAKLQQCIAEHCISNSMADTNNNILNKNMPLSDANCVRDMSETIKRIVIRCGELLRN